MTDNTTYDPVFFRRLKDVEKENFWFRVRRKWILDRISRFIPPPACLLEVGCGTGNVSSFLSKKGYSVTGCELYPEALHIAWPGFLKIRGDSTRLPFKDNTFDMVGFFDVIEHFEEDAVPIREAIRVVREGGIIALTVPARRELWGHVDKVSLHKRRYNKEMIRQLFSDLGMLPLLTEYMFMSLYLPMKFLRRDEEKVRDEFRIHRLVNSLMTGLFEIERTVSKAIPLPIGTSLIALAKK
jgi:SAM-dependent methyltransferase